MCGVLLAVWARAHLGRNWSPAPALKENHELVTTGPYALLRHPIYTGVILAVLGSALVSPPWFITLIIVIAIFAWRTQVEERIMMKEFPKDYAEYRKHTWRLVPYVW